MDLDLRIRTMQDSSDARGETTDQMARSTRRLASSSETSADSNGDSNGSSHPLAAATDDSAQLLHDPRRLGICPA